jgi:hypothetical protein
MRRNLAGGAFVLLSAVLSGCAAHGAYYARYGPPPAPRYGIVGVAPGSGYVWTEGYWDQRGGNWSWVGGRWIRPPRPRSVWVTPQWTQEGRRWKMHRGYWR